MVKQSRAKAPNTGNSTDGEESEKKTSPAVLATDIEPETDIDADQMPSSESAAPGSNDPLVATYEADVTPEFEILEELGKEGLEVAETASISLADGFRQLANESACYTKELLGCSYAFAGELRQAKSPVAAVQVQIDFARSSYARLLDHFLKVSGLYWGLLCQASKPNERGATKAEC